MRPPNIVGNLDGTIKARGIKQDISQLSCIFDLGVECFTKHPGFVPTARVGRTQAVFLEVCAYRGRPGGPCGKRRFIAADAVRPPAPPRR